MSAASGGERTFSLEVFLSDDGCGFNGKIKQQPSDFCVTEMCPEGRPASVEDEILPPAPPPPPPPVHRTAAKRRKVVVEDSSGEDDGREGAGGRGTPTAGTKDVCKLEDWIGAELACDMAKLSHDYQMTKTATDKRISLGVHNDKGQRARVHQAVRLNHPVLKTETIKSDKGTEINILADPSYAALIRLLPHAVCERVLLFASKISCPEGNTLFLPSDDDKAHRTEVHRTVNQLFGAFIETKALPAPKGEGLAIQLRFREKQQERKRRRGVGQGEEPGQKQEVGQGEEPGQKQEVGQGEEPGQEADHAHPELYLRFSLQKENMETSVAIQRLSDALGCQVSHFSFAGLKDRRAVTVQHMVVRGVTADRLQTAARVCGGGREEEGGPRLKCGGFSYVEGPLRMGELWGNQFSVVVRGARVRNLQGPSLEQCLELRVRSVREKGFVNYYGEQRFGVEGAAVNAHDIGLAMLKGDHMGAVGLLLQPEPSADSESVLAAKRLFAETGDSLGALSLMPWSKVRERMVLKALHRHGHTQFGCTRALLHIPYSMRLLYVHSFTSLLWNRLATHRIRFYGNQLVEGDLVEVEPRCETGSNQLKQDVSPVVRVVTVGDVSEGRYTMHDVVIPLAGANTVLPANSVGRRLEELLQTSGVTKASFKMKSLALNVPGSYRKLIAHPHNLTWKVGRATPPVTSSPGHSDAKLHHTTMAADPQLELTFSLQSSCYATVLLRELMHDDT